MSAAPTPGDADPLRLRGVIPPTLTLFDEDGSLDQRRTAEHAEFVVENGVHGVFPLGTTGEFALLSSAERDRVIRAVVEAVGDDVPVIAGVGQPGTRETIERVRTAENAGVDGVVVVTPFYYPVGERGIVRHYRTIAEAAQVPVYVYHIPSKTGNAISLDALSELASIPGLAGPKASGKDVPWLGQAIAQNPQLTFVAGSDSLLVPGLDLGCSGMVSAVADVFPGLVVELYEAYSDGERGTARDLQKRLFEIRSAVKRGPYMAGIKEALSIRGFDAGNLRDPLGDMSDDDAVALEQDLDDLGVL